MFSSVLLCISTAYGQNAVKPKTAVKPVAPPTPVSAGQVTPAPKTTEQADAASKADPRVTKSLTEIGFKYSVTPLGNFKVPFKADDGRAQWVYISSRTEKFNTLETRKIWSTVMISKEPLSQEIATKLLMENIPQKLGAYELAKTDDGGYKVQFAAKVDANCRAPSLKDALRLVFLTADTKEKELTGADEF